MAVLGNGSIVVLNRNGSLNANIISGADHAVSSTIKLVNTPVSAYDVSATAGGGFTVTYSAGFIAGGTTVDKIHAQRFDAQGNKIAGDILVDPTSNGAQFNPHIAAIGNGGFALFWTDAGANTAGSVAHYLVRTFDASGVGGIIFDLGTTLGFADALWSPKSITSTAEGGFAIAWSRDEAFSSVDSIWEVGVTRFDATGLAIDTSIAAKGTVWPDGVASYSPQISATPDGLLIDWWANQSSHPAGTVDGSTIKETLLTVQDVLFSATADTVDFNKLLPAQIPLVTSSNIYDARNGDDSVKLPDRAHWGALTRACGGTRRTASTAGPATTRSPAVTAKISSMGVRATISSPRPRGTTS